MYCLRLRKTQYLCRFPLDYYNATPTISSVHNGFELWTLDFFVISSFFVMYGAGFKPALLIYADLVIYSTATPFRVSAL